MSFAWFTSKADVNVNTISTGTFDIDIKDMNDQTVVDVRDLDFVRMSTDASTGAVTETPIAGNILWEPNATYRTETFKVTNEGDYALKFKIDNVFASATKGTTDPADLKDVLTYKVMVKDTNGYVEYLTHTPGATTGAGPEIELLVGEEKLFYIEIHMIETASNNYQNCSFSGIAVNVSASQLDYETDSYDSIYDETAPYETETAERT